MDKKGNKENEIVHMERNACSYSYISNAFFTRNVQMTVFKIREEISTIQFMTMERSFVAFFEKLVQIYNYNPNIIIITPGTRCFFQKMDIGND